MLQLFCSAAGPGLLQQLLMLYLMSLLLQLSSLLSLVLWLLYRLKPAPPLSYVRETQQDNVHHLPSNVWS